MQNDVRICPFPAESQPTDWSNTGAFYLLQSLIDSVDKKFRPDLSLDLRYILT